MKTDVKLSSSIFDDLLWCATRYCIGRQSYVSSYAQEFWNVIKNNKKALSIERLKFFARDIRTNISEIVGMYSNVKVENAYNDKIVGDAYSLLASYIYTFNEKYFNPEDWIFTVDCVRCTVHAERNPKFLKDKADAFLFTLGKQRNLAYWAMLANCIDNQYELTLEKDGVECKKICIFNPFMNEWAMVNNWNVIIENKYLQSYKHYK